MRKELVFVGGTAAAGLLVIGFMDPALWPKCPIHAITGIWCPGCGGQRAVSQLLQGNPAAAIDQNAIIFAIPVFIALGFVAQKLKKRWLTNSVIATTLVVATVFTVLRNLPGSWLAPN